MLNQNAKTELNMDFDVFLNIDLKSTPISRSAGNTLRQSCSTTFNIQENVHLRKCGQFAMQVRNLKQSLCYCSV